jgi:hypothetical protein
MNKRTGRIRPFYRIANQVQSHATGFAPPEHQAIKNSEINFRVPWRHSGSNRPANFHAKHKNNRFLNIKTALFVSSFSRLLGFSTFFDR